MYQIHYMVPTANGSEKEHFVRVSSYEEFQAVIQSCEKYGYTVVKNPMCSRCMWNGCDCDGEVNWVYTGCANRRVA